MIEIPKTDISNFEIQKAIPYNDPEYIEIKIDIDELKNQYKIFKATNQVKQEVDLFLIENKSYNINYFINIIDSLDSPIIFHKGDNYSSMYIKAKNGVAIILPYRIREELKDIVKLVCQI
jgi:hypothetical protein